MNDKELLDAVKLAAGVPADGWGVTWNPLYNPGHCQELIASKRVHVIWPDGMDEPAVMAHINGGPPVWESIDPHTPASNAASLRRAVCRAVVGGAA